MLEFISWLIIIYLAFKLISRFLLPYLVKWGVRRFQEKYFSQNSDVNEPMEKEGSIHVQYKHEKKQPQNTGNGGEYVDFEELPKE